MTRAQIAEELGLDPESPTFAMFLSDMLVAGHIVHVSGDDYDVAIPEHEDGIAAGAEARRMGDERRRSLS